MSRKVHDCRDYPSDDGKECSLAISGDEAEVVDAATKHAVEAHGFEDTPAIRARIRAGLKDERPDVRTGFDEGKEWEAPNRPAPKPDDRPRMDPGAYT